MKAVKRAIPVEVEFVPHPGVIQTLEGPVSFEGGDALLTGARGERWPVSRSHFEVSYRACPPGVMGENGQYVKLPVVVDVRRLAGDHQISLGERGTLHGHAGDWQVTAANGESWIVEASVFDASYALLDQGTARNDG
jgi:hypothetical protein